MQKKLNKIVSIPCEVDSLDDIIASIKEFLVNNEDYKNGNIVIGSHQEDDEISYADVTFYEGCADVDKLTMIFTS